MYRIPTRPRQIVIGNQTVIVDSKLEERVIRKLHANGYTWVKPTKGINVGRYNYTPDLELSVQHNDKSHRAILEIKPGQPFFNTYISRRMLGIRRHYETELFLIYFDQPGAFYRLDTKGVLAPLELPPPGKIPIHKLYNPVSMKAPAVYSHRYIKKIRPGIAGLTILVSILETFAKAMVPPRRRRKGKKKPLI